MTNLHNLLDKMAHSALPKLSSCTVLLLV